MKTTDTPRPASNPDAIDPAYFADLIQRSQAAVDASRLFKTPTTLLSKAKVN